MLHAACYGRLATSGLLHAANYIRDTIHGGEASRLGGDGGFWCFDQEGIIYIGHKPFAVDIASVCGYVDGGGGRRSAVAVCCCKNCGVCLRWGGPGLKLLVGGLPQKLLPILCTYVVGSIPFECINNTAYEYKPHIGYLTHVYVFILTHGQ